MNRRDFLKFAGVGLAGLYVGKDLLGVLDAPAAAAALPGGVVGEVVPFVGPTTPEGWLLCDGSVVPRATYARLYALVGDTYGRASGARFRLPDFRGRILVGPRADGLEHSRFLIRAA